MLPRKTVAKFFRPYRRIVCHILGFVPYAHTKIPGELQPRSLRRIFNGFW